MAKRPPENSVSGPTELRQYSSVEYVFEPNVLSLPNLREYMNSVWERRAFMVELARADMRSENANTALGSIWSVLNALFQVAIYYFLFTVLREGSQSQFLPILIANIFLFGLTTSALGEAGGSIRRSRGLMLSSTFPRAILPMTEIYKSLRIFIPSACVFLILFPLVGGTFGPGLLVLPLLFVIQLTMNLGIALLTSAFVVLVADARNVMAYITRILFFATPVIYPVAILPPGARLLICWQPLFALFASYQAVFSGEMPNLSLVLQAAAWAVALLVIGARIFLRREREFAIHL